MHNRERPNPALKYRVCGLKISSIPPTPANNAPTAGTRLGTIGRQETCSVANAAERPCTRTSTQAAIFFRDVLGRMAGVPSANRKSFAYSTMSMRTDTSTMTIIWWATPKRVGLLHVATNRIGGGLRRRSRLFRQCYRILSEITLLLL